MIEHRAPKPLERHALLLHDGVAAPCSTRSGAKSVVGGTQEFVMEHKSQTFVIEEFEKNTKGHEKGVSADLRDPFRTLTEVPHKLTFSQ